MIWFRYRKKKNYNLCEWSIFNFKFSLKKLKKVKLNVELKQYLNQIKKYGRTVHALYGGHSIDMCSPTESLFVMVGQSIFKKNIKVI